MTKDIVSHAKPIKPLMRFAAIFLAWTAFGLLTAVQARLLVVTRGQTPPAGWSWLAPPVIGFWIWALYTPGIIALARRFRRLRESAASRYRGWIRFFGVHLAFAAVVVVGDAYIWAQVRPLIDGVTTSFARVFAGTLIMNIMSYLAVVTLTEAADYAARSREREREAAELARRAATLEEKLDEARLNALETQLQPHFLYNTLNLVAELVHDEPDVADDMLTRLGGLLRRSYRASAHVVPLREEISFVRAYAEILARRYRDRVTLTFDVSEALEEYPVPAFLLQPLVENAFRHGVEKRERASGVDVSASQRDGRFIVRVRDRAMVNGRNGHDASAALIHDEPNGDGIGLRNTRERLELLYGSAAGLTLTRMKHETVAVVWLPSGVQ